MSVARIPFNKIEKNSNVIIYGFGYNGERCYHQLIESGYAKLTAIVDNQKSGEVYGGKRILSHSSVFELDFDYIIISIIDEKTVAEIENQLILDGCDVEKIIVLHNVYKGQKEYIFEDDKILKKYINDRYQTLKPYTKKSEELFYELANYIEDNKNSNVKSVLIRIINSVDEKKISLHLLLLMYKYGQFDSQCMQLYMQLLMDIGFRDYTLYNLLIDTTFMVFEHPDYMYDSFFRERIKLQEKICEEYHLKNAITVKQDAEIKKKIAIAVERFCPNNITDAPSIITEAYAKELDRQGYKVKIFNLYSYAGSEYSSYEICSVYAVPNSVLSNYSETCFENTNIEIYDQYIPDIKLRLETNIQKICEYNPDLILDFADEMFVEAYALFGNIKIVHSPFRGCSFSSKADKFIFPQSVVESTDFMKYSPIIKKDIIMPKLRNRYFFRDEISYSREEKGFEKRDFIIVTVGMRLRYEITEEMISNVVEMMKRKCDIKWVLVGDAPNSYNEYYIKYRKAGRIIEWGVENNLFALYKLCDVFLNPIRHGGGMAIRIAMCSGLPIVMSDYVLSDSYSVMNKDHIIHGKYDHMMKYVEKLREDKVLYKRISEETKEQVNGYSLEEDIREQMGLIYSALFV